MAHGTVSLHSWNDGIDDDEGDPPVSTNYNARLDVQDEYNEYSRREREPRRGLRSRIVRPSRFGHDGAGDEAEGGGGAGW
jgi:DDB1- and CUL4-associated factor 11